MYEILLAIFGMLADMLPLFSGVFGLGFVLLVFNTGYFLLLGGVDK